MLPRATYRLQFNKDFGFARATEIVPYLASLGVSHVYASPWLKARPGSTHGYDIVDHHQLNPELGSTEDFDAFTAALQTNGLGQIVDFVPNHMGVGGADNPLWLDVLEWGRDSAYAGWFDIDWESDRRYLRDKVLAPLLGDQFGVELHAGKLRLKFDDEEGSFAVWAYDSHKLPVNPLDYQRILGVAHPDLERLGDAFRHLPDWRSQIVRRARELKGEIADLARKQQDVRSAIEAAVARFNGVVDDPESWRPLFALVDNQYWRVAYFRVAADDINYRRFFNINELAGLRMELPDVFEHAHALVLRLLAEGVLDGLRIDHIDGLLNPKEYLGRLRAAGATQSGAPFYLVVEKILSGHESLREDWPVDGTTGYEFGNLVLGLLIDPAGEEGITRAYVEFTRDRSNFSDVVRECKLRIMRNEMSGELNVLAREAARVAQENPATSDFTHNVLRRALREIVACFPVYRIYLDWEDHPSEADLRDLTWAIGQARAKETDLDPSVFDFLYKLLSGELVARARSGFSRQSVLRCAMKFQQYSAPVLAKGLEDTAFYRYNRFVALNEPGGDPEQFGVSIANFHKANIERAKRWPDSMLNTSTHDSKRGEDTRARLAVLAEMPEEWSRNVDAWSRILRARRGDVEGIAPPSPQDEYLFYQLLVSTWPVELTGSQDPDSEALDRYADRLKSAMTKSIREARVRTSWMSPNSEYEGAVLDFVAGALDVAKSRAFLANFLPFQEKIARLGVMNSITQTALKLTVPGVPDVYQGADLWDFSLVDPDNRRPVAWGERAGLLEKLDSRPQPCVRELLAHWQSGAIKLFVTSRILRLRAEKEQLFRRGDYEPLPAAGLNADLVCAFARRKEGEEVIVVTSRFPARQVAWADTTIPVRNGAGAASPAGSAFRELLTGRKIEASRSALQAADVLAELPAAILIPV
ncbi:MAG TPA: malto-oligosyltrehalose synthase [Bryobacteraceae bacterium]|nr:malto-oligosyltrehalose synthase [Bryobacteraceae bacterium]